MRLLNISHWARFHLSVCSTPKIAYGQRSTRIVRLVRQQEAMLFNKKITTNPVIQAAQARVRKALQLRKRVQAQLIKGLLATNPTLGQDCLRKLKASQPAPKPRKPYNRRVGGDEEAVVASKVVPLNHLDYGVRTDSILGGLTHTTGNEALNGKWYDC